MMVAPESGEFAAAFKDARRALAAVIATSVVINVLLLGAPLYMLLVYDTVLPSTSRPTLTALFLLLLALFAFQAFFEVVRSRILRAIALAFDRRLRVKVLAAADARTLSTGRQDEALSALRDLDAMRIFLSGPGPGALIDLPWILFFLVVLTFLHFWFGLAALVGTAVLSALTLANHLRARTASGEATRAYAARARHSEIHLRLLGDIRAMGMEQRMHERWLRFHEAYLASHDRVVSTQSRYATVGRTFRVLLQSIILTIGALLVIAGDASAGVMTAASILAARALAPVDLAIANWQNLVAARIGYERLSVLLATGEQLPGTRLPAPSSRLDVRQVAVRPPGFGEAVATGIEFSLDRGEVLAVIGPNGAGKSSLAKTLLGIWQPGAGEVRLDGACLDQWRSEDLGRFVGYLPDRIELLDATVAQNISRLASQPEAAATIAAAEAAGVHEMILGLPQGYDTMLGPDGIELSAGQKQRLGLARALYGDPFLIVLDEPGSNLDELGERALREAIERSATRGAIIVLVAHRASALAMADKVLVLRGGQQAAFGARDQVLGDAVTVAASSATVARADWRRVK